MNVKIKDFKIEMEVKTSGIEFELRDPAGKFLGDIILTKTGLVWCKGRTTRGKGQSITWQKFIDMMEGE